MSTSWIIGAMIAVIGAWTGLPNPWLHFPPAVLGLPIGLAMIGQGAPGHRIALRRGWITGLVVAIGCIYWMALPVQQYGHLSWALAIPAPVLLSCYLAIYPALFCMAMYFAAISLPPWARCLFAGVFWALLEYMQSWLLTGFPWLSLSSAFAFWPVTIQTASLFGAFCLSGMFVIPALCLLHIGKGKAPAMLLGGVVLFMAFCGWARFDQHRPSGQSFDVGIVQGNVDQGKKWQGDYQKATVAKYLRLSQQAVDTASPQIIVWPETSMPFYFQDLSANRVKVSAFAARTGTALLVGSPAYSYKPDGGEYTHYNRAFVVSGDGVLRQWYDKEHLVPFGEYVPLPSWLPVNKLVEGAGDFSPGTGPGILVTGPGRSGMLICYEGIFPSLAQKRVKAGANLLVTISNDAWFGRTSAPLQHLALTVLRSVEQNRWLVRSTNTGISAFVDPLGRVVRSTPLFEEAAVVQRLNLNEDRTVFSRGYTLVRIALMVLNAFFLLWILFTASPREHGAQ